MLFASSAVLHEEPETHVTRIDSALVPTPPPTWSSDSSPAASPSLLCVRDGDSTPSSSSVSPASSMDGSDDEREDAFDIDGGWDSGDEREDLFDMFE